MSSELNQMYPVLPKGVTTPPGAVRIQMDGPDAADLEAAIHLLMEVRETRTRRSASAEAESRPEASDGTSPEPEPEAAAAATTEEVSEST